jgi:hypothetical protein
MGEPPTWPSCVAQVTAFDMKLTCVLPLHHEMDGRAKHETVEGAVWWVDWEGPGGNIPHVHLGFVH